MAAQWLRLQEYALLRRQNISTVKTVMAMVFSATALREGDRPK